MDVVSVAGVAVPADPDAVLDRVGGDGRIPVVALALADLHRRMPAVAIDAAGEDVALAVAEALPHQPRPAAAVGGHAVPHVRPRRVGEPHFRAELAVLVNPAVQVPV